MAQFRGISIPSNYRHWNIPIRKLSYIQALNEAPYDSWFIFKESLVSFFVYSKSPLIFTPDIIFIVVKIHALIIEQILRLINI